MYLPGLDEGSITKLTDVRDAMAKHREQWDDLMRRRDEVILEVIESNPKATRVDIGIALGVTDTVVRRSIKQSGNEQ